MGVSVPSLHRESTDSLIGSAYRAAYGIIMYMYTIAIDYFCMAFISRSKSDAMVFRRESFRYISVQNYCTVKG